MHSSPEPCASLALNYGCSRDSLLREVGLEYSGAERTLALRAIYDNVLEIFPTSCAYWKEYCEFEIEAGDETSIKQIFGKCLLVCLDVELWGLYVGYIKSISGDDVEQYKSCLEFTLENVGQDCRSGATWEEYLELLKSIQEGTPAYDAIFGQVVGGQPEASKTAMLRKVMHRALSVPTTSLDTIWSMYEAFENGAGNKMLAKRSLDEWRPKYHACKAVCNERLALVEGLDMKMLPLPPGKGGRYQMEEAQKWRRYCRWERDNPVTADDTQDQFTHQARITLAFEQSLSYFVHFPDIWLDYAAWQASDLGKGVDAAISVLNKGRVALPSALILHFQAADLQEQEGHIEEARSIYEGIVSTDEEKSEKVDETNEDTIGDQSEEGEKNRLKTLAWIQYMKFVKRVDSVNAARMIFMRARKFDGLQWQAYAASARFEWLNDGRDATVPTKIFELGLKAFMNVPMYVNEYAKFLIGTGDLANARSLYERALTETARDETAPLWDAYIAFEAECGSLSTVVSLESRRRESLKEIATEDPLDSMNVSLQKYKFLDLFPGHMDMFEIAPDLFADDDEEYDAAQQNFERPQPTPSFGGPRRPVPRELHALTMRLQGGDVQGPVPDIDYVLAPIMNFDFSADGIERHEAAIGSDAQTSRKRERGRGSGARASKASDEYAHAEDDVDDNDDVFRRRQRKN
jgi:cleavage stimulation factor subunit 3